MNLRQAMKDYEPQDSIWSNDDFKMTRLKTAVWNLPEEFKRVMILYAEAGSQREVGKIVGVSPSTICNLLKEIKQKIKENYGDSFDTDFNSMLRGRRN